MGTSASSRCGGAPICGVSGGCRAQDPEPDEIDRSMFENAKRLLIFTDMSTECDDECALLWLLAALNKRRLLATVELVMTDSHVRYQWMEFLFREKFERGGGWELKVGGCAFQVGLVLVNMYLAHSPEREAMVIQDIQKKAPNVQLDLEEVQQGNEKKKVAVRKSGSMGGQDFQRVPPGPCTAVVIAGAIPDVPPSFFERFTEVKYTYVVGTPGGINCPMPSWVDLLAAFHKMAPVLYLTPQFTRGVRFPTAYAISNKYWNEHIKHTVWDSTITCMARRPEMPPPVGNWGLVLRLNVANAIFCKEWYLDATGQKIEQAERPEALVNAVRAYVQRNSGDDRKPGAVLQELKMLGVDCSPQAQGPAWAEIDAQGQPTTDRAREAIREMYKHHLFEQTFICLLATDVLLLKNRRNMRVVKGQGDFERMEPRCGYVDMNQSLANLYGPEEAIDIAQSLPLKRLTPAYDVVAMICMVTNIEGKGPEDLGLRITDADSSMGMELLTKAQREASKFPISMVAAQDDDAVNTQVQLLNIAT